MVFSLGGISKQENLGKKFIRLFELIKLSTI